MRRFFRCLGLNARQVILRQLPLFCLILLILGWLFLSVDRSLSLSLRHYDYARQFFDRTEGEYALLIMYPTYAGSRSTLDRRVKLREDVVAAAGQEPLLAIADGFIKPLSIWASDEAFEKWLEDTEGQGSFYAYYTDLLGIVPCIQKGRWLQPEDLESHGCVISAELEPYYPLGSQIRRSGINWQVVGILQPGEHPLNSDFSESLMGINSAVWLQSDQPFMIVPAKPDYRDVGANMWFRLEGPIEELRDRMSDFGYVLSPKELVDTYLRDCLHQVFLKTPHTLFLLFLSLVVAVTIMVINFGRNRQRYAVMCLLGQSQRMLTGCICTVYTLTVLAAYGLSRLCLALQFPAYVVGTIPSISVAHWAVIGLAVVSALCVNGAVLLFFRHSPMTLFTENK